MSDSASHTTMDKEEERVAVRAVPGLSAIEEEMQARTNFSYSEGQKILRRIDWHLVPILCLAYFMKGLDGAAVSYVKTMNPGKATNILAQLGMSSNDYSYNSTVYTVFVALFEIPSTLLMKKSTPRLHYCRILFFWSIAQACQAAAKNKAGES